jgi:hypothetical protein
MHRVDVVYKPLERLQGWTTSSLRTQVKDIISFNVFVLFWVSLSAYSTYLDIHAVLNSHSSPLNPNLTRK